MGANPFTNIVNTYDENTPENNQKNVYNVLQFNRERSALKKLKKDKFCGFGDFYDEDSFLSEPYK